jgi:hypothetical protein
VRNPRRRTVTVVTLLMLAFAGLCSCGRAPRTSNPTDDVTLLKAFGDPGNTATISAQGSGNPCFDTMDAMNAAADAAADKDTYGMQGALDHSFRLRADQRVRVTGMQWHYGAPGAVRLRIETGANAGRTCWVAGDLPGGIVKNIQFKK